VILWRALLGLQAREDDLVSRLLRLQLAIGVHYGHAVESLQRGLRLAVGGAHLVRLVRRMGNVQVVFCAQNPLERFAQRV